MQLPYIFGQRTTNQSVTADAELIFDIVYTNDDSTFKLDTRNNSGLLILRPGLYRAFLKVNTIVADIAVPREVYTANGTYSAGVGGGFGVEFGQDHFAMGTGQNQSGVSTVTSTNTISKAVLDHISMAIVDGDNYETNPRRLAGALIRSTGVNWTVGGGLISALTIERVGDVGVQLL